MRQGSACKLAMRLALAMAAAAFAAPRDAAAQWTSIAPLPLARYEAPNVALNGRIYVFGGFVDPSLNSTAQVHVFDPTTNAWSYLTDIPTPMGLLTGLTHHGIALERDRFIWIAGGFQGPNGGPAVANVWKYDIAANTWTAGPSLPAARAAGPLVVLGRELHYFGGVMADRNTDAGDHWVLNLDQPSPSWVTAPPLPTPRNHLSGAVVNGKIYAMAGWHHHDVSPFDVSVVEVYDPATSTWSTAASTPTVRSHFEPGTFVRDGRIVIVGGKSDSQELTSITEYDPLTNTWTDLAPSLPNGLRAPIAKAIGSKIIVAGGGLTSTTIPQTAAYATTVPSADGTWFSLAPLLPGRAEIGVTAARGKVYVLGGTATTTLINTVSVFDPISNSWADIAPLPGPARDHIGAATVDDKVYAIGGLTGWPGPSVANVYMYDPINPAAGWVTKASLPIARGAMGISVINGKIYAAGGLAGSVAVNYLTAYDPLLDAWTTLAPMTINRDHLTAQAIDGKLYAIGGRDTAITATTAVTAVYDPATNAWTNLAPMLSPRGSIESGVLAGRIYVYGADTGTTALAVNEEYDPGTNSWRSVMPMITARSSSGGAVIAGRIFAPGGKGTDGVHNLTVNEVFYLTGGPVSVTNQPPVVNAGIDRAITLPTSSVQLSGAATDDGLPLPPGALTYAWSFVSGPAAISFSTPAALTTTASGFTVAGTYTLRLTVSDSVLSSTDDVVVFVNPAGTFAPVLINAGGPAFTDGLGQAWSADKNFSGGTTYTKASAIAGTMDDTLFQTERYGNFSYNIAVPSGTYSVTLRFAELYWTTAGKRVFSVSLEGQTVLSNFDIFATAGANTALDRTFQVTVTDGTLNIAFATVVDNAKVSAIQVVAVSGTPANQAPIVNAGQDKVITLPTNSVALSGAATDDGLPTPPGSMTYVWSVVSGPAGTTFSAQTSPATTVTFPGAGTYTLRLTANDSALSGSDDVIVTVNATPVNQPPVANAGADKVITLPTTSVALAGAATDDGLPSPPATLTYTWAMVSGPASVTFSAPASLSTTATFTVAGTYTLRLSVSDSVLTGTDDVIVTVNPVSSFTPVRINSGGPAFTDSLSQAWAADKNFSGGSTYTKASAIAGTVDDALFQNERYGTFSYNIPVPSGTYAVTLRFAELYWTSAGKRVFNVTIEGQTVLSNFDIFAAAGANTALDRTFQATVSDGTLNIGFTTVVDNAKVSAIQVVSAGPPANQPPVVNAGPDKALTLPTTSVALAGSATDDGLPAPPAALTYAWSVVSGPSGVTFSAQSSLSTTATFPGAGTYTLRLTVSDSALSASDDVIVAVNTTPVNQTPVANAGPDKNITLPTTSVALTGTATDDGLPSPPATLTYLWSMVSGPAAVTFSAPTSLTTTATFTKAGTYTLRLSASDSALTGTDDLIVIVNPVTTIAPILINAGGPAYTDTLGQVWSADQYFTGGTAYSVASTTAISGTVEDALYRTERFGNFSYNVPVPNGTYEIALHFAEIYWTAANKRIFSVTAEGSPVINSLDIWANAGTNAALPITFEAPVNDGVLNLVFTTSIDNAKLSAIEIRPQPGDPFLHVVINAPAYVVDYDGSGSELVALEGHGSHTHELGRRITSWVWTEGSTVLGTTADISVPLTLGNHQLSLTISDDNVPSRSLTDSVVIPVYPLNAVGGVQAQYYPAGSISLSTFIDALPSQPGFIEVLPALRVDPVLSKIGGSAYSTNVVAQLKADYTVTTAGTYQFTLSGGTATRFFIQGNLVTGPVGLSPGTYPIEARFAVADLTSLPAQVMVSISGGAAGAIPGSVLHNNQTLAKPFINSMTTSGSALGGETAMINGFGFFPSTAVIVHWGGTALPSASVFVTPTAIAITTPPGTVGPITVTVETPNGISNAATFTYLSTAPVIFGAAPNVATVSNPTQAAWGPDGRLYVGTVTGQIYVYTFDDNYAVTNTQVINGVSGLTNNAILGIAFNPFDPPSPVRIYVSHSALFGQGGACFSGPSPYAGQVSRIDGPGFLTVTPIVTGLPSSNHDHGVNGLVFDNNGDLLIAEGGNTNAGVAGNCNIGQLPESPLSAAILKAQITKPGFNGTITYRSTSSGQTQNDQSYGETVNVAPGVDVSVWAPGLRNAFDLVLTTAGRLFATDNGPNDTFGGASLSAFTQAPDPTAPDKINRVVEGGYYGHPNRSRGRYAPREYVYRDPTAPAILGQYTAPLTIVPSSTDGIDEYRATTFNNAMRGTLLVQKLDGSLYGAKLNADGTAIVSTQTLGTAVGLDVLTGPAGAILTVDYNASAIKIMKPNDAGAPPVVAYDIFPWRGRSDGTTPFVIGGAGFGLASGTTVTIGGITATVTSVSPTRIRGVIPAKSNPTADLVDVVVQSAGQTSTISRAFRYLLPNGSGKGTWGTAAAMSQPAGEMAGGVIDGVMYMIPGDSANTLAFDIATETWQVMAPRPVAGSHHSAEVVNGKLYLFGGLDGAEGRVQIFNPATNSWTLGAPSPVASGSASTALINGLVYMAGGIAGSNTFTTNAAAVYNPVTNTWTAIASMPLGRNHAAAGTDGSRLFVFGGRGPGSGDVNQVAEGFDDVQIYDPATNTWACSCTSGSTIAPLPQKRGGMGKAPFYRGEFYVMGGETTPQGTGQVAGDVYNRVDVFNPAAQTWRLDANLPTARHGIFPLVTDGRIFVAGGGTTAGISSSSVVEVFGR